MIALSHHEIDEYANIILKVDDKKINEHMKIAQFYEVGQDYTTASTNIRKLYLRG
jgi:hypothetical protein